MQKSGAQIGKTSFIQSALILLVLMLVAGLLTRVLPAGRYARIEVDGREMVDPASFTFTERPHYPAWRWAVAPLEVLVGPDGPTVIVIVLFILMVGVAFAVMDRCGVLQAAIGGIVRAFGGRKYLLLLTVSAFFMALGAFFGIFEEVVPLVPLILVLSWHLGWDTLTGLGMSILATNMGFSAAVTNPFTIGVAQKLAGLPPFSGAWFRIIVFLVIYGALALFLTRYARRVERDPQSSPVYAAEQSLRARYAASDAAASFAVNPRLKPAMVYLAVFLVLIVATLLSAPFVPFMADIALPLVGLLFLIGGIGAGLMAGEGRNVWKAALDGLTGIAPAVPLILMAASVKHIVASGGILDTILHSAAGALEGAHPLLAVLLVYGIVLGVEFFVPSGSAKAFLLMPILVPLADLIGVTRQVVVTAYCFGDGFSNMAYPTNPVLLISLGLASVGYPRWIRWTAGLWAVVILLTGVFLGIAVAFGYGPF